MSVESTMKTLLGGRCPRCGSFVKEGLTKCPVCGYELKEGEEMPKAVSNGGFMPYMPGASMVERAAGGMVKCPKCGTLNPANAKFCKNCRYPLKGLKQESKKDMAKAKGQERLALKLQWVQRPKNLVLPPKLSLEPHLPYFDGLAEWEGYGFMVYKKGYYWELIVRRVDSSTGARIFARLDSGVVVPAGTEFYLGAVGFQVLGAPHSEQASFGISENSTQAVVTNEGRGPGMQKTRMVGPGGEWGDFYRAGNPRVRILNLSVGKEYINIEGKTVFGREYLVYKLSVDEALLAENGVSNEHVELLPLSGGNWLITPVPGKFFYIEIIETPLILNEGAVIRWIGQMTPPFEALLTIEG